MFLRKDPVMKEGKVFDLWCHSGESSPATRIEWRYNGTLINSSVTDEHIEGDHNGTKTHSVLHVSAERHRNGDVVTCVPHYNGDVMDDLYKSVALNVTCKFHNIAATFRYKDIKYMKMVK